MSSVAYFDLLPAGAPRGLDIHCVATSRRAISLRRATNAGLLRPDDVRSDASSCTKSPRHASTAHGILLQNCGRGRLVWDADRCIPNDRAHRLGNQLLTFERRLVVKAPRRNHTKWLPTHMVVQRVTIGDANGLHVWAPSVQPWTIAPAPLYTALLNTRPRVIIVPPHPLARIQPNSGQVLSNSGKTWSLQSQCWSGLANFGPTSV